MPEIKVKGMSCPHCSAAVSRGLEGLPGISEVHVDLAAGRVTYQSTGLSSADDIARVIKNAGYEVAG